MRVPSMTSRERGSTLQRTPRNPPMFMPGPPPGQPFEQPMMGQPGLYPPIQNQMMPMGGVYPSVPEPATQPLQQQAPIVGQDAPAPVAGERAAPTTETTMEDKAPPANISTEDEKVQLCCNESEICTFGSKRMRLTASGSATMFADENGNLKLVNMIVRCPCCTCVTVILICLVMTMLLFGVIISGLPFTEEENAYDVFDVRSKDYDSFRLAQELTTDALAEYQKALSGEPELQQQETIDIVYWIYEAETDGGMFTSKGLDDIQAAESIFLNHPDWRDYCVLEHFMENETRIPLEKTQCERPLTPMTVFFPDEFDEAVADSVMQRLSNEETLKTYNQVAPCIERGILVACEDVETTVLSEMEQLMMDINTITDHWNGKGQKVANPAKMAQFCAYMKQIDTRANLVDFFFDKEFSVDNPVSMFTRSVLTFGGPRKGYESSTEQEDEQGKEIKDFVLDYLFDDMDKVAKRSNSDETNTFYFMTQLIFDIFIGILIRDTSAAIMSILLVYFYLWHMLGSLFLASTGMLEIILSLPCAWFIFRGIFQIEYFAGLNALTIFIVAAIGADDIFVFWDAYKQSAHQGPKVTKNLATRMSWVWRKSGLAMAITSATTCCAFLCTVITPLAGTRSFGIFAALVILWDYVLVMSLFCTSVVIYHNRFERDPLCDIPYCCGCCTQGCACDSAEPGKRQSPTDIINTQSFHGDEIPQDKITKFFSTQVTDFVLSMTGRIVIAVIAIAWLAPAIYFVTQLEPTKTAEQFLREDHPLQYSITIINNEFPQSSENPGLRTYFAWGIDTLDQGGVNQLLDDDFVGKPVFKPDFTFTPTCQKKLLEACDYLEFSRGDPLITRLIKKSESGFFQVKCFLRSFEEVSQERDFTANATEGVPMENLTLALNSYFSRIPREVEDIDLIQENIGFDGTSLRWVSLEVESSTLDQWSTLAEDVVRDVYEGMLELRDKLDEIVGDSCGASGVLMTDLDQKFVFMNNQRIYRTSAVSGAVIGVVIALVVLLAATRSPILALLSTLCILCTIMSVIGVVTMIGWTLGTVEAILISILAGFSVDYVVHLAHAYAQSYGTREERLRTSFGEMGTPVLSGMLTSVLASLPLFTCQIVFFAKFGTFLCFTILFSWLFANFVFMGVVGMLGPARERDSADAQGDRK